MERQRTALIAGRQLSPQEVRDIRFSKQRIGGYDTGQVDRFRGRVAREFDSLYQRLQEADSRMAQAVQAAQNAQQATVQMPVSQAPPSEPTALRLLQLAQQNAEQVEEQAREEARRLTEHARQQAERIIADARRHAQAERKQIIEAGTTEARRLTAAYMDLTARIHAGLRKGTQDLGRMLGEWADEAGPEVAVLSGTVSLPGAPGSSGEEPAQEPEEKAAAADPRTSAPKRSRTRPPAAETAEQAES